MSSALTPPPADHTDERARNGGTSAPRGGSVWDAAPVAADVAVSTTASAPTTMDAPIEAPAVAPTPEIRPTSDRPTTPVDRQPDRPTEPLLGAAPTITLAAGATPKVAAPSVPAAPKRAVPQTPNARQREKARQAIAAAAAGRPVRTGPSLKTLIVVGAGVVLALTLSVVAWIVLLGGDTEAAVPVGTLATQAPATTTTLEPADLEVEAPAIAAPAVVPSTTLEPADLEVEAPAIAAPAVVPSSALAPSTTADPATTAAPTTTAAATTTAPATSPTTVAAVAPVAGPRIVIEPRREGCKFGSDCLVAGFTIVDFAVQPDSFVCEFADGSRYTIPLEHHSVSYACATGSRGDSITIEIDGIRSDTAVHD